jgi:predicted secreted protein
VTTEDRETLTVTTYRDKAGEWRWRAQTGNGRIVADSGEGYEHDADASASATRLFGGAYDVSYTLDDSEPTGE